MEMEEYMKIRELIEHFETIGSWVNWDKSKDMILHGSTDKEITKVGVCWVATKNVIEKAIEKNINFIISHENAFYLASTSPHRLLLKSANEKRKMLDEHDISIYRCHDVWDCIPTYGVADTWAKDIGLDFMPRAVHEYHSYAEVKEGITVLDVAKKVVHATNKYGENGVQIIGNKQKKVRCVACGTGALTDVFKMVKNGADLCIVSDDGIDNWIAVQWAVDNDVALIIVNHAGCEIGGLKNMVTYLQEKFPYLQSEYLEEGYSIESIVEE